MTINLTFSNDFYDTKINFGPGAFLSLNGLRGREILVGDEKWPLKGIAARINYIISTQQYRFTHQGHLIENLKELNKKIASHNEKAIPWWLVLISILGCFCCCLGPEMKAPKIRIDQIYTRSETNPANSKKPRVPCADQRPLAKPQPRQNLAIEGTFSP
jgi:hypothetical protein